MSIQEKLKNQTKKTEMVELMLRYKHHFVHYIRRDQQYYQVSLYHKFLCIVYKMCQCVPNLSSIFDFIHILLHTMVQIFNLVIMYTIHLMFDCWLFFVKNCRY